jgi:hypothetical protein
MSSAFEKKEPPIHTKWYPLTASNCGYWEQTHTKKIDLRMVPDDTTILTAMRFWSIRKLMDTQKIKTSDLTSGPYTTKSGFDS